MILRFALAFNGLDHGFCTITASSNATWVAWSFGLLAIFISVALLVGFLTPVAGAFASVRYLVSGISLLVSADPGSHSSALPPLNLFVMSLALVLLGPGAFSLDARLFGHREIIIPDGGRSRH